MSLVKVPLTPVERQGILDEVDIAPSARKHGILGADILHALDNAMWRGLQLYDGQERIVLIGPARNGDLLELVVVPALVPSMVIHAAPAREKFLRHLRELR